MKTIKLFIIAAIIALAAALLGCEDKPDKPSVTKVRIGEGRSGGAYLTDITADAENNIHPVYRFTPFFNKELFKDQDWSQSEDVVVRVEVDFIAAGLIKSIAIEGEGVAVSGYEQTEDEEKWLLENKPKKDGQKAEIVFDSKTRHVEHWLVKPRAQNEDNESHNVSFTVTVTDRENQMETADITINFGGVGAPYYTYIPMVVIRDADGIPAPKYYSLANETVYDVPTAVADFMCLWQMNAEGVSIPTVRMQPDVRETIFSKLEDYDKSNPALWWDTQNASGSATAVTAKSFFEVLGYVLGGQKTERPYYVK